MNAQVSHTRICSRANDHNQSKHGGNSRGESGPTPVCAVGAASGTVLATITGLPVACLHDFKGVPQLPCLAGRLWHAVHEVCAEGIESHLWREPNRKQTIGGL